MMKHLALTLTTVALVASPLLAALSPKAAKDADAMLQAYEQIHARLSADSVEGIAASAATLAKSARAAAPNAGAVKPKFEAVASAASNLKAGSQDLSRARAAFGPLSKAVVELVQSAPELAVDMHLFTCPMAKGYGKWVQSEEKIANPYYGKSMLRCGSKTEWSK